MPPKTTPEPEKPVVVPEPTEPEPTNPFEGEDIVFDEKD